MNIQGKIWGKTQNIFFKNNVEIHRIEINKDGFCSKHKHEYKYNAFFVEKGKVKIKIWKNNYDLVDETIIETGEITTVEPKECHQFEALEDSIVYEIYWVELLQNDIQRENIGGNLS